MFGLPLHPAVVHLPIGLSFTLPIIAFSVILAVMKGWLEPKTWIIVVILQALLLGSAFIALETGENEEDQVEQVVAEKFIEAHEEQAEQLPYAASTVLILSVIGLWSSNRHVNKVRFLTLVGILIVSALTFRIGHSGGELVFTHGASRAYTIKTNSQMTTQPTVTHEDQSSDDNH